MIFLPADGVRDFIQLELDMFRMTALFVVERNKGQLVSELFKLLKLSSQASKRAYPLPTPASKTLQRQQTLPQAADSDEDDQEIPKFNPRLMKQRGGEAHSARTDDTQAHGQTKRSSLHHMPSDATSAGMSDDDGMSNFEAPSAVPDSKLRSVKSQLVMQQCVMTEGVTCVCQLCAI